MLNVLASVHGGHSDFMGCFVKGFSEENQKIKAKLMLKTQLDTESESVLLYICPECGDIGCGAYSVRVTKTELGYKWKEFAYENGYEEPRIIEGVGPFDFAGDVYEAALLQASAL